MKICLISQEYPPETGGGGIGTQTYLKAQGLTARGHEVHVISSSWDAQARTYQDGRAVVHRIPEPELGVPGFEESTNWLAHSAGVARKVHELAGRIGFDLIQFPEYGGEGFIYQTDTFPYRTARYVVQLHGPLGMFAEHMGWPPIGSTLHQIGCFMERLSMHNADLVLASSHNTAAFCASHYDYPLDQIRVIHSGIDTAKFSPQPDRSDPRQPKILFVGNLAGNKGFNLLVDVVLRLRDRHPRICLRAIGKGVREQLQQVAARIAAAGAEANFEIKGYVPYNDLPAHYAWCDFFAGPSLYEPGPGNVYLEAMACGKPVIAGNTAGAPEVVLDGRTGLLVPPTDAAAVAQAIVTLAADAALRQRLGANGRDWIVGNFSVEKYLDKVERLYQELMARPRQP